jgi:hypothetical protein
LFHDYTFDVDPILGSRRERLVHDQVFCGARAQKSTRLQLSNRRALDRAFFKRHRAEGNIQPETDGSAQEHHTVLHCEGDRIGDATAELFE